MLDHFVTRIEHGVSDAASAAAIGLGAGIALAVGVAFWTVAGWMLLVRLADPLIAAVVMGALYTGAGLIALAIMSMRRRRKKRIKQDMRATHSPGGVQGLLTAFMTGMTAGSQSRS
ncbi:hypothetical protein [Sulfitobacter sp. S190]|uniref:hypothetical protein n=1 Tax=Sulfitobacter sp. S190 TaxID=2867022 RepID=UPI0021A35217|nr:hypothetical protein [Sulfitobacter sp. S190]UWR22695.1 hypothetical protein K3756_01470 [Sulfitobacter sp. S190]